MSNVASAAARRHVHGPPHLSTTCGCAVPRAGLCPGAVAPFRPPSSTHARAPQASHATRKSLRALLRPPICHSHVLPSRSCLGELLHGLERRALLHDLLDQVLLLLQLLLLLRGLYGNRRAGGGEWFPVRRRVHVVAARPPSAAHLAGPCGPWRRPAAATPWACCPAGAPGRCRRWARRVPASARATAAALRRQSRCRRRTRRPAQRHSRHAAPLVRPCGCSVEPCATEIAAMCVP